MQSTNYEAQGEPTMRLGKLALFSFAVTLTLSSLGAGQSPSAPAAPTLHVYSRETIVDVLVTDDKGQPVRGLTRSDFTVEEDGKAQPIRSFHEYDKDTPPAPVRTLPPGTYTNSTALPASGPVQIFLFDLQVTTDGHAAAAAVDNLDVEWFREWELPYPLAIVGANRIADYVAAIHGRKNLIWIVPGSPPAIMHDGGYSWGGSDMTIVHRLMDLYDRFTQEQIAIYPFDPRGVHGFSSATLMAQAVADETGGATSNSNDYQSTLADITDSTLHAYTLSFIPPRPQKDGHYHTVTIKLDRPGLHLNYRPGYNDEQPLPRDAVLNQLMIQGPMRLGAISASQVLFDLQVQPASSSAQPAKTPVSSPALPHTKGAPYDTTFTFDPTQIALTETPDGTRTANIELDLGAFDFYGKLVATRSQTFKITVTPAQYNGFFRTPLKFSLPIDLPHGQLTLRAGLFDTAANKVGTLEIPLTVPKSSTAR